MTVDAYREKIIETVVRVFNELTDYRFSKSADMPESIEIATVKINGQKRKVPSF